jgi:hypothetical protein
MKIIRTANVHSGEVYRVPADIAEVHVLSGLGWVTVPGKDLILSTGEIAMLAADERDAVVSSLGERPVVIEELG